MGIAEDQEVNAVEERGEQDAPDGEVGDKGEFFKCSFTSSLFGISRAVGCAHPTILEFPSQDCRASFAMTIGFIIALKHSIRI